MTNTVLFKTLVSALRSQSEEARWRTAAALSHLGEPGVEPFVSALSGEEGAVWEQAIEVLSRVGWLAVGPLSRILADREKTADERALAVTVIGTIGHLQTIPLLIGALSDEFSDVSGTASIALCKIGKPVVQPLIKALSHQDENIRRLSAQVLSEIGDPAAIPPLTHALQDPSEKVRESAKRALSKFHGAAFFA